MDRLKSETQRPDLRMLVEKAFRNRIKDKILGESQSSGLNDTLVSQTFTNSSIEVGRNLKTVIESGNGDEIIEFSYTPQPHVVTVDDLGEYHWLLRYAAEVCFMRAGRELPPGTRRKLLKKDLAHEFQHALAGKGEDGLHIKYAVIFSESLDGSSVSWQPGIILTGKARRGIVKKILQGVSWLSKGDQVALE